MMNVRHKQPSKCFISAPACLNINPLYSLLQRKKIQALDAFSLSPNSIFTSVTDEIEKTDFLIAVLSKDFPNDNVLYELGFARGAKKPIFLIVQEEKAIPAYLKNELYFRASIEDSNLVSLYLDQFLSKYKKAKRKHVTKKEKPFVKSDYFKLEEQLSHIKERGSGEEFLHLVAELFRSQGFVVDISHGTRDEGADMSIWIDSLGSTIGNPILVELKLGNLSESILEKAEKRMQDYLCRTNLRSGLLIYLDRLGRHFKTPRFQIPFVIRLDLSQVFRELHEQTLDRIILEERNRIAHPRD